MKHRILLKVSCILICIVLLLSGASAFAAETETLLPAYTGLFPPSSSGRVSLMSISDKEDIKADIKAALEARSPEVDLREYSIPVDDVLELYALFYDVLYENPGLFYVKTQVEGMGNGTSVVSLVFSGSYAYTDAATISRKREQIDAEVDAILATIDPAMSDAEKALAVHDWFVLRYAYNVPASQTNELSAAHRIDGLFIDKTAVCQGYALGYTYVLQKLGIDAIFVPGNANHHAWNMVRIGGAWYHVDVTHDDPLIGGEDRFGYVSHKNFLRGDAGITETGHYLWESPYTASTDFTNMFWEDITSGLFYLDGKWYYKDVTNTVSRIVSRGFMDTAAETLLTVDDRWFVSGGSYYAGLFGIGIYEGRLYYNAPRTIRSIDPSTGETSVHAPSGLGDASVCDMLIFGDTLYMSVAGDGEEEREIRTEALPFDLSLLRTDSGFTVHFPLDVTQAGICFVAWYEGEEMVGMRAVDFAAGTAFVTVEADAADCTDARAYVWSAGVAPLCKSAVLHK
ncbi:MAG: hypothetical protein IJN25_08265 [Clostridia bacterium]|nr:hypothetical protein [Clostridia bacterium]